ncbi:MAG TPA: hypothetical protein VNA25_22300 [Phycisphaerae bacterium]|nr:hypothetical protein [Phycisphaerae bacterium]
MSRDVEHIKAAAREAFDVCRAVRTLSAIEKTLGENYPHAVCLRRAMQTGDKETVAVFVEAWAMSDRKENERTRP